MKKIIILILLFVLSMNISIAQGQQWTWGGGGNGQTIIVKDTVYIGYSSDSIKFGITLANYLLDKYCGLSSAIGFDVQLLTGVPDRIYYLFKPSEFNDEMYHLIYTPMGLINYKHKVTRADLNAQSIMGISISIIL